MPSFHDDTAPDPSFFSLRSFILFGLRDGILLQSSRGVELLRDR